MRYVTQDDIKNFNELYIRLKTYAAVSRATGFAPSTVKKYIIPNYEIVDKKTIKVEDIVVPNVLEFQNNFFLKDWNSLCLLSKEEFEEIKELWKELEL